MYEICSNQGFWRHYRFRVISLISSACRTTRVSSNIVPLTLFSFSLIHSTCALCDALHLRKKKKKTNVFVLSIYSTLVAVSLLIVKSNQRSHSMHTLFHTWNFTSYLHFTFTFDSLFQLKLKQYALEFKERIRYANIYVIIILKTRDIVGGRNCVCTHRF